MKQLILKVLQMMFKFCGYHIIGIVKINKKRRGTNLNVGSSSYYDIDGFLSLDYYSDHYYKSKKAFNKIHYDIRKDKLPFKNGCIDNIYISHVIEHIETKYIEEFIKEAYRVLKSNDGVLRIVCPDAEFLYEVSRFKNDYFNWLKKRIKTWEDIYEKSNDLRQIDYLINTLASPKMRFYKNRIVSIKNILDIEKMGYKELSLFLEKGLAFREKFPGDHISIWDFSKIKSLGDSVGFSKIIRSKKEASISREMQGQDFDLTHPQMSLYVDLLK